MSPEALRSCAGYSVNIQINGRKALGVLRFAADGSPCVIALCYVDPSGECPMLSRTLDPLEIESLQALGSFHLGSSVTFTARDEPLRISAVDRLISGGHPTAAARMPKRDARRLKA
jgi:hypothetical protein